MQIAKMYVCERMSREVFFLTNSSDEGKLLSTLLSTSFYLYLRSLRHFIVLLEKRNCCFEHSRLVHLAIVLADHGAQLGYQHVELVPPLLLGQVPRLPLGLVLLVLVLHVVVLGHGEGGGPARDVGRLHHLGAGDVSLIFTCVTESLSSRDLFYYHLNHFLLSPFLSVDENKIENIMHSA